MYRLDNLEKKNNSIIDMNFKSILKLSYSRVAGAGGGGLKDCWSLGKDMAILGNQWNGRNGGS